MSGSIATSVAGDRRANAGHYSAASCDRPTRLDDVTENTLLRKTTDGIIIAARTLNNTDPAHR
jgi:hypothetical protein